MSNKQKTKQIFKSSRNPQVNQLWAYDLKSDIHMTGSNSTPFPHDNMPPTYNYKMPDQQEKIIPGYNFQSLFRKKSHIKLSKKKNKEQISKRNSPQKNQVTDKEKNIQKGHWTNEQNKLYHYFLEIHNRHFVLKHLRRTDKIFKSMANFMKSREAQQCRSHHQKMQKKYHNFYQILIKLRMDLYNSLQTEQIVRQLEQKGFKLKQNSLLSVEQLKNGEFTSKQVKQEDKLQQSQYSVVSYENNNILSQNYEKDLDFNKMHFQT